MNNLKKIYCSIFILFACASTFSALLAQDPIVLKADKAKFDLSQSNKPLKGNVAFKPLQGGVTLSHSMPPTPPSLHKGAIFEQKNIPLTPKCTDWYSLPSWLAGDWHRETFTSFLFGVPVTRIERANHIWGHQIDRLGTVWHHRCEPYIQIVDEDDFVYEKNITLQEPISVSDSKVVMHYKDFTVKYNKHNRKIFDTFRHEQISVISKKDDQLFETVTSKDFNADGSCAGSGYAETTYNLIRPFHPANTDRKTGLNLQEDFKIYLATHGFSNRIPNQQNQITKTIVASSSENKKLDHPVKK